MATPAPARPHVLFTAVRRADGRTRDLLVSEGRIAAYDPAELPDGCVTVDAQGALALPSPVDAHIHPDKSTWGGPWLSREPADTLRDLIEGDVRARTAFTDPVAERVGALMDRAIARGTRAMRAHVDVAPVHGLSGVHGVRAAADARKDLIDVQIVAFPQLGLLSEPGTAELMEQALSEGADVVGGLDPIGIDGDMEGQLDFVFGLAARKGVPLDIHLHDGGPAGIRQVTEIARRTVAAGMQGDVTLGHAFAVAELDRAGNESVAALLAGAGVSLVTCALGGDPVLDPARLTPHGVRLAVGSDGVRDAWTPFGDGDMIARAHLLAYRTDARTDDELAACYEAVAQGGAALLGLPASRLETGDPADFVLVAAGSLPEAVVDRPVPSMVVREGRIIAREGRLVR
ncbi:amidohydrolase [Streptomyces sp. NPDC056323]|uniref:amidohydrolase n=1 Tax=Streptomyces sp. NPDC056323 TaxID=3345784 RepID=UPI0035DE61FE